MLWSVVVLQHENTHAYVPEAIFGTCTTRFCHDVPPLLSAAGIYPRLPIDAHGSNHIGRSWDYTSAGVLPCGSGFP
jgi:hypothetical protein